MKGITYRESSKICIILVNVQDILAVKEAATEVMKEFSNLGLEIGAEFKNLVRGENKGQSFDVATDVTTEIIHDLASNGDYNTMYHAIGLSDPQRMEQISGKVVEKMISEFSFNAVFNKEKDKNLIFEEMMKVIYSFRGGEALWIPRGGQRKIFNLRLFMNASSDFKTLIKVVLSNRFYLGPEDTKGKTGRGLIQYDQSDNLCYSVMYSLKTLLTSMMSFLKTMVSLSLMALLVRIL